MADIVHLIRHAQSRFNAAMADTPWVDPMIFDSALSAKGEAQADALRRAVADLSVDLVVTSPLTRAIQTTLAAFGARDLPILVEALCTERVELSQDVGRPSDDLAAAFPMLRFDHLAEIWWYADPVSAGAIPHEPEPVFQARVTAFRDWLRARPEQAVAVVSHGTFLQALAGERLENAEQVTLRL